MGQFSSKCEFVDSSAVPCQNKMLSGGYKFCYAHKCRECINPVIDKGYHYCQKHTCQHNSCKAFSGISYDKVFCGEHLQ